MEKVINMLLNAIETVSTVKTTVASQYIKDLSVAIMNLKNAGK